MTRKEQLTFCRMCINKKINYEHGLQCNLTGEKATFQNKCNDFIKDEIIKIKDSGALDNSKIKEKLSKEVYNSLQKEQNLKKGIISGVLVGFLGAILWALITVITEMQISYMAIAIGAVVGLIIRKYGNGVDQKFGFWGAGIALVSCVLGNFFSLVGFVANAEDLSYIKTLLLIDYSLLPSILEETFRPIDLLFYGFAIYEGYKFSFRTITEKDINDLVSK